MGKISQPYSERSLEEWISSLTSAASGEERLRALQAIGFLSSTEQLGQFASQALADSDPMVRALAAKLLSRDGIVPGQETLNRLNSQLDDEDPDLRFESARTLLKNQGSENAVRVITAFLSQQETHPLLLAAIINALAQSQITEGQANQFVAPSLQHLLTHEKGDVREAIASLFVKWPELVRAHRAEMLTLLDDEEPVVRERIAVALGQSGLHDDELKNALQVATKDEDPEVARVATEALARMNN